MWKRYGLFCTAIMLATVFAAFMPVVSAGSSGGNFNLIAAHEGGLQKVLLGQNLEFEGFSTPVVVSRVVSGYVANTYPADNNRIYNVNWPTAGAFFVNYNATIKNGEAQLSVGDPIIPLTIKVGSATVEGVMVGTTAIRIDTAGINLFEEDVVDLVINGPTGQISHDAKNGQQFTGITVSELKEYGTTAGLKIGGWKVGEYTFQVKTVSGQACGLEDESEVKNLNIGEIPAEPTPTPVATPAAKVEVTPLRTAPVVTPSPVPTSAPTPVTTVMPSPSVAPVPVSTPIPTPVPTPTPATPCFEFMCAVVGLVVAVCLIGRRG